MMYCSGPRATRQADSWLAFVRAGVGVLRALFWIALGAVFALSVGSFALSPGKNLL
jgi:hypothetical protein